MRFILSRVLLYLLPACALAQSSGEFKEILDRLTRLEEENRALANEVHALRDELASTHKVTTPDVTTTNVTKISAQAAQQPGDGAAQTAAVAPESERLDVAENRVQELEQTKVEASQRFPIKLTGTLLFNAFLNGRNANGQEYPTAAQPTAGMSGDGASFRQSVIGLLFDGPTWAGAKIGGTVYMDFFQGSSSSLDHLVRLRIATMNIAWKNTTLTFGQDKPILSPREPNSLAQVGVSPLTGAGNLWIWQPQARLEQRISLGASAGLKAQVGLFETAEGSSGLPAQYANTLAPGRPGYEGRFEFWKDFGSGRRIEIAPGFHFSTSHVAGTSVPSDLFSIDWMMAPFTKLQFSGMFFDGQNIAGLGSLRQGYTFFGDEIVPIHAEGGWAQISLPVTPRVTFNVYSGEEADRASDLLSGAIRRNLVTAGNVFYRFAPNVLGSFEISQTRTAYILIGNRINNHYDLALAYLFSLTLELAAGTVTGRVELKDSRDPAVRSKANYAGLVVSLLPVDKTPVLAPAHATIRQKGKTFLPHILAITAGTVVDFPNDDPIFHNAFSNYNGQLFDLTLYPPGSTRSVLFKRPGVVRVFCNIHASMSAVIVVLKTPYFAVSKRDGTFTIPDVPAGGYQLSVFHERATDALLRALDQHVTIPESSFELPTIAVSETGYLPAPHSNKYGQAYAPARDENQVYPGVRQ